MKILISASSSDEAVIARTAGVSWLDLKDVHSGPLGKASLTLQQSVLELYRIPQDIEHSTVLSVACGELVDSSEPAPVLHGFDFAKLGLSKVATFSDPREWKNRWQLWAAALPARCSPVIVCYADTQAAEGLSFQQALELARENSVKNILVDTFDKQAGGLFEALSLWPSSGEPNFPERSGSADIVPDCVDPDRVLATVKSAIQIAARYQIRIVWAGRLGFQQAARMAQVGAEVIGFRSAVCESDRGSMLCEAKIREAMSLEAIVASF